jgi:hypothetical protein
MPIPNFIEIHADVLGLDRVDQHDQRMCVHFVHIIRRTQEILRRIKLISLQTQDEYLVRTDTEFHNLDWNRDKDTSRKQVRTWTHCVTSLGHLLCYHLQMNWSWIATCVQPVRFQVLKAASIKMTSFRDIAPCSLIEVDRRFRRAYCLYRRPDDGGRRYIQKCCHLLLNMSKKPRYLRNRCTGHTVQLFPKA